MKIKNPQDYRWNDKLSEHVITVKYSNSKNIMNGVPPTPIPPYPPCCRLVTGYWGIEYNYSKDVQRKISIYNRVK
ncbi:hypothetical protein VPH166E361_0125 [Vibrio phage 166E36-1]